MQVECNPVGWILIFPFIKNFKDYDNDFLDINFVSKITIGNFNLRQSKIYLEYKSRYISYKYV